MLEVSWEGAAVEEGMEESRGGPRKVRVSEIPGGLWESFSGACFWPLSGCSSLVSWLQFRSMYCYSFDCLAVLAGSVSALLAVGTTASLWALATLARWICTVA